MAASSPVYFNVEKWIENNQKYFLPPVCNKMMHNTQLKVSFFVKRKKMYIIVEIRYFTLEDQIKEKITIWKRVKNFFS